jgi:hypothetical protein
VDLPRWRVRRLALSRRTQALDHSLKPVLTLETSSHHAAPLLNLVASSTDLNLVNDARVAVPSFPVSAGVASRTLDRQRFDSKQDLVTAIKVAFASKVHPGIQRPSYARGILQLCMKRRGFASRRLRQVVEQDRRTSSDR